MSIAELKNSVIALDRVDDYIYLTQNKCLHISDVDGYLPERLYRVINYNENNHSLLLKLEGRAPYKAFETSVKNFGELFDSIQIDRISVKRVVVSDYLTPGDYSWASNNNSPKPVEVFSSTTSQRKTIFTDTGNFDIREAIFDDGKISFHLNLKFAGEKVKVEIENPAVKKYFDSVKNYIWKLFGSRKTSCTAKFEIQNKTTFCLSVEKCELTELNESIIENIEQNWIESNILNSDREDIQSLEELVNLMSDSSITTDVVLKKLINESKTKHYHHLQYLSSRQAIELQKLSITGKPISFIFLIKESGRLFLIWETYKTEEATYIWMLSSPDEISSKFSLILNLRKRNKLKYRNQKDDNFYRIEHEYQLPFHGFTKWKEQLEEILKN